MIEGAHSRSCSAAIRVFSGTLARMPAELHETSLIALLAIGFVLALLFGLVASLLQVSPIVGYLLAGIASARSRRDSSATRASQRSSPKSA